MGRSIGGTRRLRQVEVPPEDWKTRRRRSAGAQRWSVEGTFLRRMLPNSASACSKLNLSAPALTITTMSEPGCNFVRCNRKNSRTRRFARFRSTEPPTFRLAVIPRRVSLVVPGSWRTRKWLLALPRFPRWIRRKSLRLRTRRARVSRRSVLSASTLGRRRYSQTLASFVAAALQHQSATRSGHTCTKTMTATPSKITGLIRSFHGS